MLVKRLVTRGLLTSAVIFALSAGALAQSEVEVVDGLLIEEIVVFDSTRLPRSELKRLLNVSVGQTLRADALHAAVERFYELGRYRGVDFRAQRTRGGGVRLYLRLDPKRTLRSVQVEGDRPSAVELGDVLQLERGDEVEEGHLKGIAARLSAVLAWRGWRQAKAQVRMSPSTAEGEVDLIVQINAGVRTRLNRVQVRGRLPFPYWALKVGVRPGDVLDLELVEGAIERLKANLQRQGYWDAKVEAPEVVPRSETEADLLIRLKLGPKTEVRIKGHNRVALRRLREDTRILSELGTNEFALSEAKERMLARYEKLGYFRARVDVAAQTSSDGRRRSVRFRIYEGPGSRVVSIGFIGAKHFRSALLRAQVRDTVERFLEAVTGTPGVDPAVIDRALFGSKPGTPRKQPSTAPPNARRVYVPRAYRAAVDTLADMYRSAGFQMVRVGFPKIHYRKRELVEVEYTIEEGPQWRIGSVVFSGHEGLDAQELLKISGLELRSQPEKPLVFEDVEAGRRALTKKYRDLGYAFVSIEEELRPRPQQDARRTAFDEETGHGGQAVCGEALKTGAKTCSVEVAYRIKAGPRVRIGKIEVRGLKHTRRSVVRGEYRIRSGDYLSAAKMTETRENLIRLGVFDRVVVRTEREEQVSDVKNVIIELTPRSNLSLEIGVGASTEEGFRAFTSFADRNLFGTALRFQANAKVNLWAEPLLSIYDEELQDQIRDFYSPFAILDTDPFLLLEYELAAGLSYPRIFLLPDGFSFGLDLIVLRDYDPAFAENNQRFTLIGNYEGFRPELLGKRRPMALQLRLSVERSELVCNMNIERPELCSDSAVVPVPGERFAGQNNYFSAIPRLTWDFRDNPVTPRTGTYFELEGEFALGFDEPSPSYVRVEGRSVLYSPLSPRATLVSSVRGGRIFAVSSDAPIPLNRRFYAGGRSTIRGYPEKTLLPQDVALGEDGLPQSDISTGGLLYLVLKLELRVALVEPLSLAGFYDVGDLWRLQDDPGSPCERSSPGFALSTRCTLRDGTPIERNLAQGVGFGVRLATPIGPLAIDLGFPLNPRDPAVDDLTLHFSVGAF